MAAIGTSLTNPQLPKFNGKNYDYWVTTMKAVFSPQYIWELVEHGFQELADKVAYNALTQAQIYLLRELKKKDSKSLFYIFQVVHESIFPSIATTRNFKEAWN